MSCCLRAQLSLSVVDDCAIRKLTELGFLGLSHSMRNLRSAKCCFEQIEGEQPVLLHHDFFILYPRLCRSLFICRARRKVVKHFGYSFVQLLFVFISLNRERFLGGAARKSLVYIQGTTRQPNKLPILSKFPNALETQIAQPTSS
jgi:hypothetical protein